MYRGFRVTFLVTVALLVATNATIDTAESSIPPEQPVYPVDRVITYSIHEIPTDPSSDVVFVVSLDLTAADLDGSWVGWEIESAEFRQPGIGGGADTVWTKSSPFIDTVDGLWWIEHVDPTAPEVAEFVMPPELLGTAAADDPANADLEYDLVGVVYTPPAPPETPPYENTSALAFAFTEEGQAEPIEEADEEPADTVGSNQDPE